MSDFFELPPPRKKEERADPRRPDWWGAPRGELPCSIGRLGELLVRSDDVAVGVCGGRAYTTGFELTFYVFASDGSDDLEPFPFGALEEDGDPGEFLRLGLEYSDGSRLSNTSPRRLPGEQVEGDGQPTMNFKGGQGRPQEWHGNFWCWPLPPDGAVELVCEWPRMDIPLTRRNIDAGLILGAAAKAQEILL